jgi:hypothetical protein
LTSFNVGWREIVVRPGNSQMKEVSMMLTAVGQGSEHLAPKILQEIYFPENKRKRDSDIYEKQVAIYFEMR